MSDNTNRPAAQRAKRSGGDLANLLTGVLVLGGAVLAAAWYFYLSHFGRATWSLGHDVWGQLGDFIGGVTNPTLPVLSGAADDSEASSGTG